MKYNQIFLKEKSREALLQFLSRNLTQISENSDNQNMKRTFLLIIATLLLAPLFSEVYKTGVTASYYAEDFHGKRTSNGERFNMNDYTCAHKSLPFNTILKVTNLANGKTCEVRVNDRGPFVATREIDLSKAAAVKLGMIGTGTTKVKLEIVKKGPNTKLSQQTRPRQVQRPPKNPQTSLPAHSGTFSSAPSAQKKTQKISPAAFPAPASKTSFFRQKQQTPAQ